VSCDNCSRRTSSCDWRHIQQQWILKLEIQATWTCDKWEHLTTWPRDQSEYDDEFEGRKHAKFISLVDILRCDSFLKNQWKELSRVVDFKCASMGLVEKMEPTTYNCCKQAMNGTNVKL
jgi:hypothetical protein